MELKYLKRIIFTALIISILPILFYVAKFGSFTLSDKVNDWSSFSSYLSGLLNPFISFLALLVTVYVAYSINEYEKRKDKQIKEQDDIKSYLELYQYYTGREFREKRRIAWSVFIRAVENADYADFIAKEQFVCRYTDRFPRDQIYKRFKSTYKETFPNKKTFLSRESEDRHILDAVVNFFQLLAIKDVPKDNYKVCDFYYDS